MKSERYRNISYGTVGGFEAILREGKAVVVRGQATREVLGRGTLIERPHERFPFLPERLGDPFALIAECLWVLAGRNDIEWLKHYLSRADDFSDDGLVWRAGYGPRLRNWQGVDQLKEVHRLLADDRTSRRAVMSLFDPASDFTVSRDVPCNNWLSWLVRDGRLLLNIAVRSNDAMWGFSGINGFEWSVLQELLAALRTVRLKWGAQVWSQERLADELGACPDDDFTAAAYERLGRNRPALLSGISQTGSRRYFELADRPGPSFKALKAAINQLHRQKNEGYGAAWKRRGERISVLPNIARKVDRLEHFEKTGAAIAGETLFDTAVDLLVYVLKYHLLLAEQSPQFATELGLTGEARNYSDLDADFAAALQGTTIDQPGHHTVRQELRKAVESFEDLWPRVEDEESLDVRIAAATRLRQHAENLVAALAHAQPSVAHAFVIQWGSA